MSFSGKSRTKAEQSRFDKLKQQPCMACEIQGIPSRDDAQEGFAHEIHHLLSGGRRIGHLATVALCIWHHRGRLIGEHTIQEMRQYFGPALSEGSVPFRKAFGTDAELLQMQNDYLG